MKDANATVARLHRLKDLGVLLAIDDFGTGYSSLAYLRQFPVDVLKIDRSFVSEMSGSPDAAALIHTLVELGHTLGLVTLAEGIEQAGPDRGAAHRALRPRSGLPVRPPGCRRDRGAPVPGGTRRGAGGHPDGARHGLNGRTAPQRPA